MTFTEREEHLVSFYADEMSDMVETYLNGDEPIEVELLTIAKKLAESYKNRKSIPIGTKIVIPCLSWQVAECKEICNKEVTLIDYDEEDEVWLAKTKDGDSFEICDHIAENIYYHIPILGFVYVGWRGENVRMLCT
jgi:hypothetical protein